MLPPTASWRSTWPRSRMRLQRGFLGAVRRARGLRRAALDREDFEAMIRRRRCRCRRQPARLQRRPRAEPPPRSRRIPRSSQQRSRRSPNVFRAWSRLVMPITTRWSRARGDCRKPSTGIRRSRPATRGRLSGHQPMAANISTGSKPCRALQPACCTGLLRKYLAIAMAYDDVIRVADLKTRAGRFDRVRREARAGDDQILGITEFFHPRIEELAGLLPLASRRKSRAQRADRPADRSWTQVAHDHSPSAFLMLYCVAGLRRFRRGTLRHAREMRHLDAWVAARPEIRRKRHRARNRRVRGPPSCWRLFGHAFPRRDEIRQGHAGIRTPGRPADAAEWVQRLTKVALKDADGAELDGALRTIETLFEDA